MLRQAIKPVPCRTGFFERKLLESWGEEPGKVTLILQCGLRCETDLDLPVTRDAVSTFPWFALLVAHLRGWVNRERQQKSGLSDVKVA